MISIAVAISCCISPLQLPTAPSTTFQAELGSGPQTISLIGDYGNTYPDPTCCTIVPNVQSVTPPGPLGQFTHPDALTTIVDVTDAGEVGKNYFLNFSIQPGCFDFPPAIFIIVQVVDPCETVVMSVDGGDEIFTPAPAIELVQFVEYPAVSYSWGDDIVTSSLTELYQCGPLEHILYQQPSSTVPTSTVFQNISLNSSVKSFEVLTSDFADVGQYELQLLVRYQAYPSSSASKTFLIRIEDYCQPSQITLNTFTVNPLTYEIGLPQEQAQLIQPWASTVPELCLLDF